MSEIIFDKIYSNQLYGEIKMKYKLLTALLSLLLLHSTAIAEDKTCTVEKIISGDTFVCTDGIQIEIWGVKSVYDKKAKEYLESYIKGKELQCDIRGMRKDGIVGQCINDLQVKSYDIAVPLINSKYAEEVIETTDGYYRDKKYPKSH